MRENPADRVELEHPNPFYSSDETEPLASCGYRYRKFDLSITENEDVQIIIRTEVDSFVKGQGPRDEDTYITVKTLNEFDSRAQGSGGAPDWRTKLDSQRGAVVATEMKNNSSKLARWAVQSILAGAEQMKMGCVFPLFSSRVGTFGADALVLSPRSVTSRESTPATLPGTRSSAPNGTSHETLPRR